MLLNMDEHLPNGRQPVSALPRVVALPCGVDSQAAGMHACWLGGVSAQRQNALHTLGHASATHICPLPPTHQAFYWYMRLALPISTPPPATPEQASSVQ